jgi:uncharacterized membrane protein
LIACLRAGAVLLLVFAGMRQPPPARAGDVSDAQALAITRRHCVTCHARAPSHPSFDQPPKSVALETVEDLKVWAVKLREQVVLDRNMPVGGDMSEEERAALGRWVEALPQ